MPGYIREKVIDIIIDKVSIPVNEIKDNGSLVKDYNMDGIDLVEIVTALEKEFNISITDEHFQTWMFVKDIVAYIEEATKK